MQRTLNWIRLKALRGLAKVGIGRRPNLERQLRSAGKTRWLDIGSPRSFSEGFECMDIYPRDRIAPQYRDRYHEVDLLKLQTPDFERLGTFDLVRMQHVFEHFSFEEGEKVLLQCARLLTPGGYLVITVPDLRIHIDLYLRGWRDRRMNYFARYAQSRIPADAPPSFYFSFHAHQFGHAPVAVPGQAHKWCYDREGLTYQIRKAGAFENIRYLHYLDALAGWPFTHRMVNEDLCVIAQKQPGWPPLTTRPTTLGKPVMHQGHQCTGGIRKS